MWGLSNNRSLERLVIEDTYNTTLKQNRKKVEHCLLIHKEQNFITCFDNV